MKWLKSTTQKTWTVRGRTVPACVTPHNDYLVLNDSEYAEISSIPVIKSLIHAGGILVLNEEPAELKNNVESLKGSNAELTATITQLQEQLKRKEIELTAANANAKKHSDVDVEKIREDAVKELKAEAIKELQEKEDTIKKLETEEHELEEKVHKLEEEEHVLEERVHELEVENEELRKSKTRKSSTKTEE